MTDKEKVLKKWPDAKCYKRPGTKKHKQVWWQVWNPPGHAIQLLGMARSAAGAWADAWRHRLER